MITNAVTSAARLSLAPARLAGRVVGSLARELGGTAAGCAFGASAHARQARRPFAPEGAAQALGLPLRREGA